MRESRERMSPELLVLGMHDAQLYQLEGGGICMMILLPSMRNINLDISSGTCT